MFRLDDSWLLMPLLLACAVTPPPQPPPAAPGTEGPHDSRAIDPPRAARASELPAEARAVLAFWREAGPNLWFAKDAEFDRRFRERFAGAYESAARGALADWAATADGTLALILLLDQYPRNSFRGTPRMYATDAAARAHADAAVAAGFDRQVAPELALFVYLPFGHSESLADQERSVALSRRLGQPTLGHAEHHRDIVRRFGRFPHRNAILGRASTDAEQHYLENGGYQG